MPLANVTQSLEAPSTAQMFQEKRPQERNGLRDFVLSGTAEFLNKTASLVLAGRQGVRKIALPLLASACGFSRTLADSCGYLDVGFAILRSRLPPFPDLCETMSLEMSLAATIIADIDRGRPWTHAGFDH
jgi:hypothetical protein